MDTGNWMSSATIDGFCSEVDARFGFKEFYEGELTACERAAVLASKGRYKITQHSGQNAVGGFVSAHWSAHRI